MKMFFNLVLITMVQSSLVASEEMTKAKDQTSMPKHAHKRGPGHWHQRDHHKGDNGMRSHDRLHKKGSKHVEMVFENLRKDQQEVYVQMHTLQRNIRKNMYALGQERRNIKNLTTSDARKRAQENINKICNEIRQNIEEYQPRIADAIGELK